MFGTKNSMTVNTTEYSWKKNTIKIEGDYLVSSGVINNIRVPLNAIETISWSMNPMKPTLAPALKIVGKGVVLAELPVGIDIINEIQDWLMEHVVK